MASSRASRSLKARRRAVVAAVLKPTLKWNNCRHTVMISRIDPCLPADEFHTNSRLEAQQQFIAFKAQMKFSGGEWIVEWWEHPKDRPPKRECYRRGEPGQLGFLYCAEFPRSKSVKRYDYMSK